MISIIYNIIKYKVLFSHYRTNEIKYKVLYCIYYKYLYIFPASTMFSVKKPASSKAAYLTVKICHKSKFFCPYCAWTGYRNTLFCNCLGNVILLQTCMKMKLCLGTVFLIKLCNMFLKQVKHLILMLENVLREMEIV